MKYQINIRRIRINSMYIQYNIIGCEIPTNKKLIFYSVLFLNEQEVEEKRSQKAEKIIVNAYVASRFSVHFFLLTLFCIHNTLRLIKSIVWAYFSIFHCFHTQNLNLYCFFFLKKKVSSFFSFMSVCSFLLCFHIMQFIRK